MWSACVGYLAQYLSSICGSGVAQKCRLWEWFRLGGMSGSSSITFGNGSSQVACVGVVHSRSVVWGSRSTQVTGVEIQSTWYVWECFYLDGMCGSVSTQIVCVGVALPRWHLWEWLYLDGICGSVSTQMAFVGVALPRWHLQECFYLDGICRSVSTQMAFVGVALPRSIYLLIEPITNLN